MRDETYTPAGRAVGKSGMTTSQKATRGVEPTATKNRLYFGDNLQVLRDHVAADSVDLVYLDPPFNSNQDYNVLFAAKDGRKAAAQIQAFEDTWEWDEVAARALDDVIEQGGRLADVMRAFRTYMDASNMLAYLAMMAPRLSELHRVLKPTGSLFLHCDPTASHYLKILLDAVFEPNRYRNEIIWKRTSAHSSAKKFGPVHDVLLYYVKGDGATWNPPRTDYDAEYLDKYYKYDDGDGRLHWRADLCAAGTRNGSSGQPWRGIDVAAKGMHWKFTIERLEELDKEGRLYWPPRGTMPQYKRYREELKGKAVGDIWDDIDRINPVGDERLGYPTQKPEALLDRIILACSNEGDLVLDPFCGCGTTVASAQRLKRRWIGVDITYLAIGLIKKRLRDAHTPAVEATYSVIGQPVSVEDATALFNQSPKDFELWALAEIHARGSAKKGADRGVDGRLIFHDERGKEKQILISVKGGKASVDHLRDLRGVLDREKAEIGLMLMLQEPTSAMRKEAATGGFYVSPWGTKHPRLQLLTLTEVMQGRGPDYPAREQTNVTLKKAPAARVGTQPSIFSTSDDTE